MGGTFPPVRSSGESRVTEPVHRMYELLRFLSCVSRVRCERTGILGMNHQTQVVVYTTEVLRTAQRPWMDEVQLNCLSRQNNQAPVMQYALLGGWSAVLRSIEDDN